MRFFAPLLLGMLIMLTAMSSFHCGGCTPYLVGRTAILACK